MKAFDYTSATAVDEVAKLLEDGVTRPLAGGTDLLTLMKADVVTPARLVDIKRLPELKGLEDTPQGLSLGALTTLSELEANPLIRERYPLLAEAAAVAATPQLRNMATLGGNLLQRPRCWYYRSAQFHCWLSEGDGCPAYEGENQLHALFGGGPCYAVHPSDLAPALMALDAEVRLKGRDGERTLPLEDFFALPTDERRSETRLEEDELLLAVRIPPPADEARGTYLKAMDRKVWAFALVGVAVVLRVGGESRRQIEDARLVLSGLAPIPWRAAAAERELTGAEASEALFAQAAETALAGAEPLAQNAYKLPLAKNLIRRALTGLTDSAVSGSEADEPQGV